jgi:hypothetical protein
MIYLSGATNDPLRAIANERGIGMLCTPLNSYHTQIGAFDSWAVDNGLFGLARRHREETFSSSKFYSYLDRLPRSALFVAAPDVLRFVAAPDGVKGVWCKEHERFEIPVGDAAATLAQFPEHARAIRALGFKVALVGQDGIETMLDEIPWELVDAVFLGGSDAFKLGPAGRALVAAAKARGKWIHMGRVNSGKRFAYAAELGCDSADGTFLGFGPSKNLPRLLSWLDAQDARELRRAA